MSNEFKQYLADLKSGLVQIDNAIKSPKDRRSYERALIAKATQEARIDFFKKGYNFRDKELKDQQKLTTENKQNASLEGKA